MPDTETTEPEIDVNELWTVIEFDQGADPLERPGHLNADAIVLLILGTEARHLINAEVQLDVESRTGHVIAEQFDKKGTPTGRGQLGAFTWHYRP